MKGIRNIKGATLCLPLLIGAHFDSTDPCMYHLQVNDPDSLPGTSNAYYETFNDWLAASKEYVYLSTESSQNANLDPS